MTPMLSPVPVMVMLHFQVILSLYVIPKRALQELEGDKPASIYLPNGKPVPT